MYSFRDINFPQNGNGKGFPTVPTPATKPLPLKVPPSLLLNAHLMQPAPGVPSPRGDRGSPRPQFTQLHTTIQTLKTIHWLSGVSE